VEDIGTVATARAWGLMAWGHACLALALVVFLTFNGVNGTPGAAVAGTAVLLTVGFLLPAVATFRAARLVGARGPATKGLFAHGAGLVGLLLGVACIVTDLHALDRLGAAIVAMSGAASVVGVVACRRGMQGRVGASGRVGLTCLVAGACLLVLGALAVAGANLLFASLSVISQTQENAWVDLGATVSALGCVLVTYSLVALRRAGA